MRLSVALYHGERSEQRRRVPEACQIGGVSPIDVIQMDDIPLFHSRS